MKKKLLFSLMGLSLVGSFSAMRPTNVYASNFGGGDGSLANPYLISTPEHLEELRQNVNGGEPYYGVYFKQVASIDFSEYDNDGDSTNGNFAPIGINNSNSFQGHYDGDYHTISNVEIISDSLNTGFFGYINNLATIEKLAFENLKVVGNKEVVGGVVGFASSGKLSEISVSGVVSSVYNSAGGSTGGVIGKCGDAAFEMSSITFSGDVRGKNSYTGGIVGEVYYADKFNNLFVSGSVQATGNGVGGLVGTVKSDNTSFKNVVVQAKIRGGNRVGGIFGENPYYNANTRDLYWDKEYSELTKGNGIIFSSSETGMMGLTTNQLQGEQAKTNLTGFDFDKVWETTDGLPRMKWESEIKPLRTSEANEILISGEIKPTLMNLTVPTDPVAFVINPNLPEDQVFVAPDFEVTNGTNLPLTLSIHSFEKVSGPFKDVLPRAHADWHTLDRDSLYDFALGIEPQARDGWYSLTEGIRYVADKSNYELGTLAPNGTVSFRLKAKHGYLYPSAFEALYRLTLVVGV